MFLITLFSCALQSFDSSTSIPTADSSLQDFSSYESPCLDGLVYNMRQRGCRVEMVNDEGGKKRYYCRYDDQPSEVWDAWTTRSFASWELDSAPATSILSGLDYKPACSDWSLEFFYR
jgi:hypothetical protein